MKTPTLKQGVLVLDLPAMQSLTPAKQYALYEIKVSRIRECCEVDNPLCDTPARVAEFWRSMVPAAPWFSADCECFTVLTMNTRRHIKGLALVSVGTLDTILVHPREVFRVPIIQAAAAIVLCHNHPSGDPSPSEADIKVTRDLIRAGQLLKIEVLDHVIMGQPSQTDPLGYRSLRELGYFYQ